MKEDIRNNLRKFQKENKLKDSDIYKKLNMPKTAYYKQIHENIDGYEFIEEFNKVFEYDLITGQKTSTSIFSKSKYSSEQLEEIRAKLLSDNNNYIIYDEDEILLDYFGEWLESRGFRINVLNLCNIENGDCYNPFEYFNNDINISNYVSWLIDNYSNDKNTEYKKKLVCAIIEYLKKYCPPNQQNFTSAMKLLRAEDIDSVSAEAKTALDRLFDEAIYNYKNSSAIYSYVKEKEYIFRFFRTTEAIEIVADTIENLKHIFENMIINWSGTDFALQNFDTIDLAHINEGKRILFCISNSNTRYEALNETLAYQMSEILSYVNMKKYYCGFDIGRNVTIVNLPCKIKNIYDDNIVLNIKNNKYKKNKENNNNLLIKKHLQDNCNILIDGYKIAFDNIDRIKVDEKSEEYCNKIKCIIKYNKGDKSKIKKIINELINLIDSMKAEHIYEDAIETSNAFLKLYFEEIPEWYRETFEVADNVEKKFKLFYQNGRKKYDN